MRIRPVFAWYDFWFGLYWNKECKRLYAMVPMIGFYMQFGRGAPIEERLRVTQKWLDRFQSEAAELTIENLKLKERLAGSIADSIGGKVEQTGS